MIRLQQLAAAVAIIFLTGTTCAADELQPAKFGVFSVPNDRRALSALEQLGVGWIRQQFQLGDPDRMQRLEHFINRVLPQLLRRDIGVWATFYHRDPGNIAETGSVGFRHAARGGFPPRDPAAYRALVGDTITRFHSAIARLGKAPSRYLVVQFGNEVLPRDIYPPDRPARFWHGTADQYLAMLRHAYDAVKSVDRAIPVAAGGISSAALEAIQSGNRAVAAWNDRLLRSGRFDIAALHLRHRLTDIPGKIEWVRKRWRGPLAATEIAGPDPRVSAYSDAAQARDLRLRVTLARTNGIEWLFWAALADSPFVRPVHRSEGLIEPEAWRHKPAFEIYRRLIRDTQPSRPDVVR